MGRKRIIIEIGDEQNDVEQLKKIQSKLDAIEKKMTAPWLLPAILVVLTAAGTYANYRVQRYYTNTDLYRNKVKEKVAELRATSDVDFFKGSIGLLDSIDQTFESYCKIDTSALEGNEIAQTVIRLNNLASHQLFIDSNVKRQIRAYTEFVVDRGIALDPYPGKSKLKDVYNESYGLYISARSEINNSLDSLTK